MLTTRYVYFICFLLPYPQYPVATQWKERVQQGVLCFSYFLILALALAFSCRHCLNLSLVFMFGLVQGLLAFFGFACSVLVTTHTYAHTLISHTHFTHSHTHTPHSRTPRQTDRHIEPAGTSITIQLPISFACMFVNPITNFLLI